MNTLILLAVTLLIVVWWHIFWARGSVYRFEILPHYRITALADEISLGKLGATINETKRSDEIGAFARSIERMGVSLQMAFDRLRKK